MTNSEGITTPRSSQSKTRCTTIAEEPRRKLDRPAAGSRTGGGLPSQDGTTHILTARDKTWLPLPNSLDAKGPERFRSGFEAVDRKGLMRGPLSVPWHVWSLPPRVYRIAARRKAGASRRRLRKRTPRVPAMIRTGRQAELQSWSHDPRHGRGGHSGLVVGPSPPATPFRLDPRPGLPPGPRHFPLPSPASGASIPGGAGP